jgi:hypothetical protein
MSTPHVLVLIQVSAPAILDLAFGSPFTLANAAGPLDRAQIIAAQTVIGERVLAGGLQAMLRDGGTDLITLTGSWRALSVALAR